MSILACSNHEKVIKSGKEGKPLPQFNILLMDSATKLNSKNIPNGSPLLIFIFSPYCPYCRSQTQEIVDHIGSLKRLRIYFLSPFSFADIKSYSNYFKLKSYPNVTVGQDQDSFLGGYFNANAVPYLAIYGNDKVLKQVFVGQTGINTIINTAFNKRVAQQVGLLWPGNLPQFGTNVGHNNLSTFVQE